MQRNKAYGYLILTGILSGFIVFGAGFFGELGVSLYQLALFPLLIVFLILLPFVILNKKYRPDTRAMWLWIGYGLIISVLNLAQLAPVLMGLPVAITVLLLYTQPLWTVSYSRLVLKEKITSRLIVACFVVILGVAVLANPFGSKITNWWAVLVALIGGMCLSAWVIFGSYASSKLKSNPVATLFGESLSSAIFLLLLYPIFLLLVKDQSIVSLALDLGWVWWYIIIFALLTKLICHLAYYSGVKTVSASRAGIILLLEPVSAVVLAAIFLRQAITWNIAIGGILILAANYLVIFEKSKNPA